MTQNQIAFYKAKEEAKHWKRQDKENRRHNEVGEVLNAQELSIKDWANRENVRLGYTQAEINRTHYEKSDLNSQIANQLRTDELVLSAVNTFGKPVNADRLSFFDYYGYYEDPEANQAWITFDAEPLQYSYVTPQAISGYGKALSGVANMTKAGESIVNDVYYRQRSKGD